MAKIMPGSIGCTGTISMSNGLEHLLWVESWRTGSQGIAET